MPEHGYMKRRPKWTQDEIIKKIQEWVDQYGEIPAATDWNPADCRRSARISIARSQRWLQRAMRFHGGEYPWPRTVQVAFGSWNAAIEAAGFTPRQRAIEDVPETVTPEQGVKDLSSLLARARNTKDPNKLRTTMYAIAMKATAVAEGLDEGGSDELS